MDNPGVLGRAAVLAGLAVLTVAATVFVLWGSFVGDVGRVDDQNPPWFWWAVPLVAVGMCALVLALCAGYAWKILRPQVRGR